MDEMANRAPRRAPRGPGVSSTAILVALLVRLGPPSALAAAPQERVRQTLDAVSAVLNDPELQGSAKERDRRERVGKVMRDSFDFRAMARESLGSHWASLSAEQQDEFAGLFGQLSSARTTAWCCASSATARRLTARSPSRR